MRVVICGGGVIGACTAYFLGRLGIEVIVVEAAEVAAAASGKAGGFLALVRWQPGQRPGTSDLRAARRPARPDRWRRG